MQSGITTLVHMQCVGMDGISAPGPVNCRNSSESFESNPARGAFKTYKQDV